MEFGVSIAEVKNSKGYWKLLTDETYLYKKTNQVSCWMKSSYLQLCSLIYLGGYNLGGAQQAGH